MSRVRVSVFVCLVSAAMVLAVGVPPAFAAPPANDTLGGAVVVSSLPFSYEEDTSQATSDGPTFCGNNASVFFRFAPSTSGRFQVDTFGSDYDTLLGVFSGQGSSLKRLACDDDRFGFASAARFRGQAGTTYFIQVSVCCGHGDESIGGGKLELTMDQVATASLDDTIAIQGGVTDPTTGIATLRGTMSCNQRSIVGVFAVMREVRQQIFVARVSLSFSVPCSPGDSTWTVKVESETSVVFGPGQASLASVVVYAWDGFKQQIVAPQPDQVISLT